MAEATTTVRCKFTCNEVTKRKSWRGAADEFHYAAKFSVVTDGSDEDKRFFAATPSGSIEVSTLRIDTFEVGKTYYVDFAPTEVE